MKKVKCLVCDGTGKEYGLNVKCSWCKGKGKTTHAILRKAFTREREMGVGIGRDILIQEALDRCGGDPPSFLEIGYDQGHLYRLVKPYFNAKNVQYTTVDIKDGPGSRDTFTFIHKNSVDFWKDLSMDVKYDVIFVDGCHCDLHADYDTKGAILHVPVGGIVLMHDVGMAEDKISLANDAGPSRAYLRNFVDRPEFQSHIDQRHPGGMGTSIKLFECGAQFLKETKGNGLTCHTQPGKPPSLEDIFHRYFEV